MAPRDIVSTPRPSSLEDVHTLLERAVGLAGYTPSPADWRDEVLYFLLPDRFSDGQRGGAAAADARRRPLRGAAARPDSTGASGRRRARAGRAARSRASADARLPARPRRHRALGRPGLQAARPPRHLPRLRHPGLPRGRSALRHAAATSSTWSRRRTRAGMRVILDIIVNHTGDNWVYLPPGDAPRRGPQRPAYLPVAGASTASRGRRRGRDVALRAAPARRRRVAGAARRRLAGELQDAALLHPRRRRRASAPAPSTTRTPSTSAPTSSRSRTSRSTWRRSSAARPDATCYKYWIALSATATASASTRSSTSRSRTARNFCGAISEFADRSASANFLLVGEIAGGDASQDFVARPPRVLGRNLTPRSTSASARLTLHRVAQGAAAGEPTTSTAFARPSDGFDSHRRLRQSPRLDRRRPRPRLRRDKAALLGRDPRRLAGQGPPGRGRRRRCSSSRLGIPCIYYGTEQAFAGPAQSQMPFLAARTGTTAAARRTTATCARRCSGPSTRAPRTRSTSDAGPTSRDRDAARLRPVRHRRRATASTPASPAYRRIAALCRGARARTRCCATAASTSAPDRVFGGVRDPGGRRAGRLVADPRRPTRPLRRQPATASAARGGDVVVAGELSPVGDEYVVVVNTAEAGPRRARSPARIRPAHVSS